MARILTYRAPALSDVPSSVFITGASGFIGGALAQRYRDLGAEVRGVDLRADAGSGMVEGDVAETGAWQEQAAGADLVVHTAALVGFGGAFERFWRVNTVGTSNALDAAAQAGAKRFVHLSSIVVFGIDYPEGADERWPVKPTGAPYTDAKVAAEQVVLSRHAAGEIPCTVVRPGDVYGPASDPWLIRPIEAIKSGGFAIPDGIVTPVYVDDLVEGIARAAGSPAAAGHIFTLTDGTTIENRRFFEPYHRWLGKKGPRILPAALLKAGTWPVAKAAELRGAYTDFAPATIEYYTRRNGYSNAKAREMLGFDPKVSFEEGMERSREWAGRNGLLS
jgi:nucleoside-diphosphate-sugar epimerase